MITIKQGDTGLGVEATLLNDDGVVNLDNASVLFLYGYHEIQSKIIDSKNGLVHVIFNQKHVEKSGVFKAEFEVQFEDGRVETFPNNEYITLNILQDIGGIS